MEKWREREKRERERETREREGESKERVREVGGWLRKATACVGYR